MTQAKTTRKRRRRRSKEPRPSKAKPHPLPPEAQAQVAATVPAVPQKRDPWRPSDYDPAYCQKVIEHMQQGNSLRSFGAVAHCDESSLKRWAAAHPDFRAAIKIGRHYLEAFYENGHKMLAFGQLKRVKSETPMLHDGKPVLGPDGKVLMHTEYEPVHGNIAALIFLAKNVVGWKDRREIFFGDEDDGEPGQGEQSAQEILEETREMMKFLEETQGDRPVIDVTPHAKPA